MLRAEPRPDDRARRQPCLLHVHPLLPGGVGAWTSVFALAAELGCDHVVLLPPFAAADPRLLDDVERPHPALGLDGDAGAVLAALDDAGRAAGIGWMLDVRLDAVAAGGRVAREHTALFASPADAVVDPADPEPVAALVAGADAAPFWIDLLQRWRAAGAAGFRLRGLAGVAPALVRRLAEATAGAPLIGALDGVPEADLRAWSGAALDRVEIAIDRWHQAAEAVLDRAAAWRAVAPLLAVVERPYGPRVAAAFATPAAAAAAAGRLVRVAAALGDGWLLPLGFAEGATRRVAAEGGRIAPAHRSIPPALRDAIRTANTPRASLGPPRPLPVMAPGVEGLLRPGRDHALLTLVNRSARRVVVPVGPLGRGYVGDTDMAITLESGEARTLEVTPARMIRQARLPRGISATERAASGRVAIEAVGPAVDDGRFAAKRVVGDTVTVECDIICDGHDQLAAVLQWRAQDQDAWHETRMAPLGNDRWRARFDLTAIGRFVFRIGAWRDAFATFRDELTKKHRAGLNVALEAREGRALIAAAAAREPDVAAVLTRLDDAPLEAQVEILLAEATAAAMRAADDRPFLTQTVAYPIDADRPQAASAAWYELFPRSMSGDGVRHGTFRDVIGQLPRIRAMGFDVLYFPPIHPIGRINRKGRNNTLTPAPDDPGSPYAIGAPEGGHDALHPELGNFDDFEALRQAAADAGLELAMDFAIQCAPDHPWLTQHKGWFDWRPDGSLRYAENPPKKYEDIVNVDFYAPEAVPDLWVALADVVFFWLERGVRIFRVDNPHTKPLPFWEWLIFEVRCQYPDAIFLAEAFTRPKVMNRLGKIGFHQSYTYFTWRNTKWELREYLTELTTTAARDFFRPNFFVNTPDINPPFLQTSGRAGFLIRAALAATLSGNWGMYCGFELCEATPVPGREEYLDSEKYQLRAWDWERPGNIVAEIAALNALRRRHPCLWSHLGVTFLDSDDDSVLFYEKATEDRADVLLIAVCLDPHQTHSSAIAIPLWRWGLSDQATIACRDVLHDTTFTLTGKWQRVVLSPTAPYTIWHARPQGA
jgi:starch synthase (maltosyl-transferring)